jgi:hypothetical protein
LLLLGKVDGQFAHNIYSIRTVLQGPYFQRNSTEVNRLPSMLAGLAELIKSQTPTRKLSRVYQGQIDARFPVNPLILNHRVALANTSCYSYLYANAWRFATAMLLDAGFAQLWAQKQAYGRGKLDA